MKRIGRIRATAARFLSRWQGDILLVVGVGCTAVGLSYAGPVWPWLLVGAFLFWTGWALSRARRQP